MTTENINSITETCRRCEDNCSCIMPAAMDVCVRSSDCEIQADLSVRRVKAVLLWGYIKDCRGEAVRGATVKLFRYRGHCESRMESLCHTYTDCNGYYMFDIEEAAEGSKYRIMVSQCAKGSERKARDNDCRHHRDDMPLDEQGINKILDVDMTELYNIPMVDENY